MAILKLAYLKMSKGGSHIWTGEKEVEVKLDGKKQKKQSAKGIRVYATFDGAKLEVDEDQLIPMVIDGETKEGMFWL